jgi:hypothetical protein
LRDLVISVLHRLRQSRTLHTLTFGPISGVHFTHQIGRLQYPEVLRGGLPGAHGSLIDKPAHATVRESYRGTTFMPTSAPFPEAFIINLERRQVRLRSIMTLCEDCGLQAARFPAVEAVPGWKGCGLSHQAIVRQAKERDLPWVLILEDDAHFDTVSIARFRSILDFLGHIVTNGSASVVAQLSSGIPKYECSIYIIS